MVFYGQVDVGCVGFGYCCRGSVYGGQYWYYVMVIGVDVDVQVDFVVVFVVLELFYQVQDGVVGIWWEM